MASVKKICRVCGKQYSACSSSLGDTVFRWRNVACSAVCGAEYVRRIQLSRGQIQDIPAATVETTNVMSADCTDDVLGEENVYPAELIENDYEDDEEDDSENFGA